MKRSCRHIFFSPKRQLSQSILRRRNQLAIWHWQHLVPAQFLSKRISLHDLDSPVYIPPALNGAADPSCKMSDLDYINCLLWGWLAALQWGLTRLRSIFFFIITLDSILSLNIDDDFYCPQTLMLGWLSLNISTSALRKLERAYCGVVIFWLLKNDLLRKIVS